MIEVIVLYLTVSIQVLLTYQVSIGLQYNTIQYNNLYYTDMWLLVIKIDHLSNDHGIKVWDRIFEDHQRFIKVK